MLVAGYGVLIAGLDTIALLLLFALINLLDNQPNSGITSLLVPSGRLSSHQRYHDALVLLAFTALSVHRSEPALGPRALAHLRRRKRAQADLVSRLLFGHARAPHLTRLERNSRRRCARSRCRSTR